MSRKIVHLLVMVALLLGMPAAVFAQTGDTPETPAIDVSQYALETPVEVAPELSAKTGEVEIVVRLVDEPLAVVAGEGAKQKGLKLSAKAQRDYVRGLGQKQSDLMAQIAALGGVELGRVSLALNAVIVKVDASRVAEIAALPNVRSVRELGKYEMDLTETVPYIGASAVQAAGFDGTGVRVAVLDSGIDYYHENLGGLGYDAYWADDPSIIEPGTFPTAKVIGGIDYTGPVWPNGPRTTDPDPLDDGPGRGHGTHVADIIAGMNGVAPGASLYAVKVCSSVSTSCNGEALLMAFDFALDPNMDGDMSDAVDVVNMSLGSSYGQVQDDLSFASANAVRYGVMVVASAGNSADRPYIAGSPSTTPELLSVAQTQVPGAFLMPLVINSPAAIAGTYYNTATVDWAPIGAGFTGDLVYVGQACPGNTLLANPAGKVALTVRGTCAVSLKTDYVANAGAIAMIMMNNAAGDAPTFSYGGGTNMIPTLIITQALGNAIRTQLTAGQIVNVSVSEAVKLSLAGTMAGTSSRGPSYSFSQIKPEIGAPGASVSALAGSGNGVSAFGGTSGAAPMVTGSAALLVQAYPNRSPLELKAVLMNTGETNIYTTPAVLGGSLAPITRIGGGEVRVNQALAAKTAAWSAEEPAGGLSFGYVALTGPKTYTKKAILRNYSNQTVTYTFASSFRYANDEASGAVSLSLPKSIKIKANGQAVFQVQLTVDPSKLPVWNMYGGSIQGNGAAFNLPEYDGYITISGGGDTIHMPWHILPHSAADVAASTTDLALKDGMGTVTLSNSGAASGTVDVFSLIGTSGLIPPPYLPDAGDNFAVIDLKQVGVRDIGSAVQFAITTHGTRSHPAYPAEFDIYLDTNQDGNPDAVIWTQELGTFASSGQTVVYVDNLNDAVGGAAYYYATADLRSGNMIMTAPKSALGLTNDMTFTASVYAFDNYFTGYLTDAIEGMTYTLGAPRYTASAMQVSIPVGMSYDLVVYDNPANAMYSPSQLGMLLVYKDAREHRESDAIRVMP